MPSTKAGLWMFSISKAAWKLCLFFPKSFPEMEQLNLVALQDYLIVRMLRHWFIKPRLLTRKGHRCPRVHRTAISPGLGWKLLWISHIFNTLCLSRNLPKNNETTTQENHIHYHLCSFRTWVLTANTYKIFPVFSNSVRRVMHCFSITFLRAKRSFFSWSFSSEAWDTLGSHTSEFLKVFLDVCIPVFGTK